MKARRLFYYTVCLLLLLALGRAIPLQRPNGLERLEGFEAEVGRQVLSAAREACLQSPLTRLWLLNLRLESLWLKNVLISGSRALPEPGRPLPVPERSELDYRYHYQAGLRGYSWFGIPAGRYTLSGNRDGDAMECSSEQG